MSLEFLDLLPQVSDPRRAQGKKWQLGPVLLATILAVVSGATSYREVHCFVAVHRERPIEAFGFGWKSVPAYSAIRTILRGLGGTDLNGFSGRMHPGSQPGRLIASRMETWKVPS